jgi:hypothetical protein
VTKKRSKASPSFPAPKQPEKGFVSFNVSVSISLDKLITWPPESIAALFTGIAAVLEAEEDVRQGRQIAGERR